MKTIVCGSRDWTDRDCIAAWMLLRDVTHVIEGGARGADRIARDVARSNKITVQTYEADWKKHGRAAGPIRNRQMLEAKPDQVLAFPKGVSRGTRDMITAAQDAGVPVIVVEWEHRDRIRLAD